MPLSSELVEEFQQLHLLHFKTNIGYEEAERELSELAALVRITSGSND